MRTLLFVLTLCLGLVRPALAGNPPALVNFNKQQAEQLADWVRKNPFILHYCDCCHDAAIQAQGKSKEKAYLLYITQANVVPSETEAGLFSVKLRFIIMSESKVNDEGEIVSVNQDNPGLDAASLFLSLNYDFTTRDNINLRIYEEMRWLEGMEAANNCRGLAGYPNPGEFREDLGKKYQKWASKRGIYWE